MKHLTEDELIEQACGEGAIDSAQHLRGCVECAASLAELKSDLAEVGRVETPQRDELYGERVWQAISGSLVRYAAPHRRWMSFGLMRGLSYAAVCALLVAVAFYAGRKWEQFAGRKSGTPQAAQSAPKKPQQPVVVVVLGDHLDRSERLLVELKHVDTANADMVPPLRDEARSLLKANRICRENAEKVGDEELESALKRLDHLLTEVADEPGGLDAEGIARIKNELNADGLLFEVRVLRSRARDQKPGLVIRLNGGQA